jgi:hypothetical protein
VQRATSTGRHFSVDIIPEWQQQYDEQTLLPELDLVEQEKDLFDLPIPVNENLSDEAALGIDLDIDDIVPVLDRHTHDNSLDEATLDMNDVNSYDMFMNKDSSNVFNVAIDDLALSPCRFLLDWAKPSTFTPGSPAIISSKIVSHQEKWFFCDRVYGHGLEMVRTGNSIHQKAIDPAIPIQAILWGWNTIDAKTMDHPAWAAIRAVDERVFGLWKSKAQKIALVLMASLIMQV